MSEYLFTSERLGFRAWRETDLTAMSAVNGDEEVMYYFPAVLSTAETAAFLQRMQQQQAAKGYCYFAVERLEDACLIGCIGLSDKTFEADFTPCVDIGWRLGKAYWNKGYATEGAHRCLEYGFNELGMKKIYAITPVINKKSAYIMQRIGMRKEKAFVHPLLLDNERLRDVVLYSISATEWQSCRSAT